MLQINHCEMTTVNNKIYFTGILTDHPDQGSKSAEFFLERSGAVERFLKKQVERSGAMERSP